MSRRNRTIAVAFHEAYNAGDLDRLHDLMHTDIEVRGHDGRLSRGASEVVESMLGWQQEWTHFTAELEEFVELGKERALVVVYSVGVGRRTGIKTEMRAGEVWTFRDGKVASIVLHRTVGEALTALGLAE